MPGRFVSDGLELVVRSWRITAADPSGSTMWFDPTREVPCLRSLPSDSDGVDRAYELAQIALEQGELDLARGTPKEEGGVPCEGDAASKGSKELDDLPF